MCVSTIRRSGRSEVEIRTGSGLQQKNSARLAFIVSHLIKLSIKTAYCLVRDVTLSVSCSRRGDMSGETIVGSYVLQRLRQLGLKSVFGVPGGY